MASPRPYDRVTARASAKINLSLCVGPVRPDGYHDLQTVFLAVGLYDEVTLTRAAAPSVTVTGEGAADVPADASNLAARAVALVARETGGDPAVAITVRKGIPVAGGMAGGSADAAAALVAADALYGAGLSRDLLARFGARLGSDVPFALHGGMALGTGRGERLTPVLGHGRTSWVLALAEAGLSTPQVYAELDRQREDGPVRLASDPGPVLAALRADDPVQLGQAMVNDLQPAALALRPALRRVLDAGRELGAVGALVSGSGPTVALLCRDESSSVALAAALAGHGVCRAVRRADGPVPGARVVEAA